LATLALVGCLPERRRQGFRTGYLNPIAADWW